MDFDTPLLLYLGQLIDWGKVPYRDFFDVNLPGTYFLNWLILNVFGKSDFSVRLADIFVLALISAVAFWSLCHLGKRVASAGCAVFALSYLSYGPLFALQRDFLLLLPLLVAMALFLRGNRLEPGARCLLIGASFGLVAVIKPQACLGLFALMAVEVMEPRLTMSGRIRPLAFLSAGFLLPISLSAIYLVANDALVPFVDIVNGYWPLFAELSGDQRVLMGLESKLTYRFHRLQEDVGSLLLWLPGVYGAWVGWEVGLQSPKVRRVSLVLILLAATQAFSVFIVGRFWAYHWLPCWLFLSLLSGLSLLPHRSRGRSLVLFTAFLIQLSLPLLPRLYGDLRFGHVVAPKGGRVDEMARFLEQNLRPGDTVQPLDWTEGSLNAMLAAEASVATSFVYTYQFHHHVSSVYIRNLRRRFLEELGERPPRFVIETRSIWWILNGPDTSSNFPELRSFVRERYRIAYEGEGYCIYEIRVR